MTETSTPAAAKVVQKACLSECQDWVGRRAVAKTHLRVLETPPATLFA